MKKVILKEPYHVEVVDVPVPDQPVGNEILIKIHRVGVCGSDVHMYYGKHPMAQNYPMVQGHEYSGEVMAVGPDVQLFKPGMKITARPNLTCGTCAPCRRGQYNVCENLHFEGAGDREGAAQEFFIIPEDRAVAIPDNLTYDQIAMVEPCAVGVHATNRAGDLRGKNVVVAGAGTIGNLITQFAIKKGAKKVLITDLEAYKLEVAQKCGITETVNLREESFKDAVEKRLGGEGFQTAFEAAGSPQAIEDLISGIENGGTIVIVGVFERDPTINMGFLGEHELNVIGSVQYIHEDYLDAVESLSKGEIKTTPLITHYFPLLQYPEAYKFIEKQGNQSVKVMVKVTDN